MHIKINLNEAVAGLVITTPIMAFREAMRDFRAFQKKNDLSGCNSALKRAHGAAQQILSEGGKLPATYANEVTQYGLDKKTFKVPFKIKAVKPASNKEQVAKIKTEFAEHGFKIKSALKVRWSDTPYIVDGVYANSFSDPSILIESNGTITVYKRKGAKRGVGGKLDGKIRRGAVLGVAKTKAERTALLEKLARIRKREFAPKDKAPAGSKTKQFLDVEAQILKLQDERDKLVKAYDERIQKLLDSRNPIKAKK